MKRGSFFAAIAAAIGLGGNAFTDNTNTSGAGSIPLQPGKQKLRGGGYTQRRGGGKLRRYMAKGSGVKLRQTRLDFIYDSIRQANEIAKARRADYVARRTVRWRSLVEKELPRMLNEELRKQGLA